MRRWEDLKGKVLKWLDFGDGFVFGRGFTVGGVGGKSPNPLSTVQVLQESFGLELIVVLYLSKISSTLVEVLFGLLCLTLVRRRAVAKPAEFQDRTKNLNSIMHECISHLETTSFN